LLRKAGGCHPDPEVAQFGNLETRRVVGDPAVVAGQPELRFGMNSGAASTPTARAEGACRSRHLCHPSKRLGAFAIVESCARHSPGLLTDDAGASRRAAQRPEKERCHGSGPLCRKVREFEGPSWAAGGRDE
jgi:hypothetical protein